MILSKMITKAMATGTFFEFGPRRVILPGFLENPGPGSIAAARLRFPLRPWRNKRGLDFLG